MLKQRIITALILAPLALWALFGLSDDLFMLLFGIILLLGAWEWTNLSELQNPITKIVYLFAQAGVLAAAWWMTSHYSAAALITLMSVALGWLLILFWLALYEKGAVKINLSMQSRLLVGLLLLPATFLGMAFILTGFENDRLLVMLMLLLIWGADVAAYTAGRLFGKNKLAPTISPGKTWEGVAGAALMTIVIACVAAKLMDFSLVQMGKLIFFSLIVSGISIVGDLFESILKRQAGMKDSGNILPGHGGILDRIDSLIAATPIYAVGIYSLLGMS